VYFNIELSETLSKYVPDDVNSLKLPQLDTPREALLVLCARWHLVSKPKFGVGRCSAGFCGFGISQKHGAFLLQDVQINNRGHCAAQMLQPATLCCVLPCWSRKPVWPMSRSWQHTVFLSICLRPFLSFVSSYYISQEAFSSSSPDSAK
jgi:hypothetical protein